MLRSEKEERVRERERERDVVVSQHFNRHGVLEAHQGRGASHWTDTNTTWEWSLSNIPNRAVATLIVMLYYLASLFLLSAVQAVPSAEHPFDLTAAPLPSSHLVSRVQAETPTGYSIEYTYMTEDCAGEPRKAMGSAYNVCYVNSITMNSSHISRVLNQTDGVMYFEYTEYYTMDCSGDVWYSTISKRNMDTCNEGYLNVYVESEEPWLDVKNGLAFL